MSKHPPSGTHRVFSGGVGGLMRKSLADALFQPNERREPKPQPKSRAPVTSIRHPDAVVLEVRRLRENLGLTTSQIVQQMAKHNVSCSNVDAWVRYANRAHLVPDPKRTKPYTED